MNRSLMKDVRVLFSSPLEDNGPITNELVLVDEQKWSSRNTRKMLELPSTIEN